MLLRLFGLEHVYEPRFCLRLPGASDRNVVEADAVAGCELLEVPVVGHDAAHVNREQARSPAEQQVVQAVSIPRDHQYRRQLSAGLVESRLHLEAVRERRKSLRHFHRAGVGAELERNAHEEKTCRHILELRRFDNISALFKKKSAYRVNYPGAVGTRQVQDKFHEGCDAVA